MSTSKIINGFEHVSYDRDTYAPEEMTQRTSDFYSWLDSRRSVRDFSNRPVPRNVIENLILAASTAPSGAHKQPWTFCVVSNPEMKAKIRQAAEQEEYESYNNRMSEEWLDDLKKIGTDWNKPFLEIAPYLIVVFKKVFDLDEDGTKHTNYYVNESVGLASGMLLAAIHKAGLVALTHTPSPMNFLKNLLGRPENERPFLLIPVGYPAEEVYVPKLERKPIEQVSQWYD
ncbi:MAG TPA: nitroreductase family protein [Cytophagales bacterium]|nr:nitroreductase family protein [Cytophagales bacterium]HAA20012.1 nitroreductase family protein [Cytophagales bacterium]HAP64663.1 nitroreductase family protein [Cytophagales bacterium]